MAFDQDIQRGIDLLTLCQELQNEKDGVDRCPPDSIDKSEVLDQFAQDIGHSIMLMAWGQKSRRIEERLRAFALAHPELIEVEFADSYSEKVLDWLERTYPTTAKITK